MEQCLAAPPSKQTTRIVLVGGTVNTVHQATAKYQTFTFMMNVDNAQWSMKAMAETDHFYGVVRLGHSSHGGGTETDGFTDVFILAEMALYTFRRMDLTAFLTQFIFTVALRPPNTSWSCTVVHTSNQPYYDWKENHSSTPFLCDPPSFKLLDFKGILCMLWLCIFVVCTRALPRIYKFEFAVVSALVICF